MKNGDGRVIKPAQKKRDGPLYGMCGSYEEQMKFFCGKTLNDRAPLSSIVPAALDDKYQMGSRWFHSLSDFSENRSFNLIKIESIYFIFFHVLLKDTLSRTVEANLKPTPRGTKKEWMTEEILNLMNTRREHKAANNLDKYHFNLHKRVRDTPERASWTYSSYEPSGTAEMNYPLEITERFADLSLLHCAGYRDSLAIVKTANTAVINSDEGGDVRAGIPFNDMARLPNLKESVFYSNLSPFLGYAPTTLLATYREVRQKLTAPGKSGSGADDVDLPPVNIVSLEAINKKLKLVKECPDARYLRGGTCRMGAASGCGQREAKTDRRSGARFDEGNFLPEQQHQQVPDKVDKSHLSLSAGDRLSNLSNFSQQRTDRQIRRELKVTPEQSNPRDYGPPNTIYYYDYCNKRLPYSRASEMTFSITLEFLSKMNNDELLNKLTASLEASNRRIIEEANERQTTELKELLGKEVEAVSARLNEELTKKCTAIEEQYTNLKNKLEKLEKELKKNNIIIFGLNVPECGKLVVNEEGYTAHQLVDNEGDTDEERDEEEKIEEVAVTNDLEAKRASIKPSVDSLVPGGDS
nr:unnamed protein product [Callosobruchus analis]